MTWKELNPLTMTEWLIPYIWPARQNGTIPSRKEPPPPQWWKTLTHNEERFLHLHLTWKELNPLPMNRMAQPLHLTYSSEWLNPIQAGATSAKMMEDSQPQWREISVLTSDMEGTKSFSHEQNGTALTSDLLVRMAQSHPMMEDSQP